MPYTPSILHASYSHVYSPGPSSQILRDHDFLSMSKIKCHTPKKVQISCELFNCNIYVFRQQTKDNNVRFEVFMAVTMKKVVFWDIKTQFVLHRRHITSPLLSPVG
jgi:hypothetical protein